MRKRFRKMTALLLAVVMVTLMIPITTISVSAGTVIENAISWALGIADDDSHGYSQLQNRRWGNPDYDCSTFVITAFANAGCDVEGATYTGNMRSVFENAGFTWIPKSQIDLSNSSQLVRGDILLNEANHTEIYIGNNQRVGAHTGTYDIYDRNSPGDNNGREISIYNYSNSSNWDGVLRYNDEPDYVNVGDDFYAYIINTDSWLLATNDNGNVNVSKENYNSNQVWHFTRLSNGSYKIVSQKDNGCMEVHNFETQNGTNVEIHPYNDNSAQHWYIYGKSAQYIFRAECGDNVLDLSGGAEEAGNGSNLQMWENNGTNAQKFQIWKLDFPSLGTPNVEISNYGGTNGDNIKLTWNACENATGYDIRIYDESGNNNLYMYYNVQGTSFTTRIPSGNYIAEVTALNSMFNTWQFGTQTFFSCANNFGTDFYAYIINTDSWLHATNNGKGNVLANTLTGNSNQIWHFERLENGSYKVISCMDNQCMEVHNFESSNGTNVEMHHYDNNSAQHWYIYGDSSQFIFRAECGDNVLDLTGGAEGADNGTNLQMWENNGTNAQRFQLWILDKPNLQAPDVIVQNNLDENDNNIKLSWNGCNDATGYDIRILDENGTDILYMFYNIQGTSFTTKLPQGNYIAEVTALNNRFNIWEFGSRMPFQVKNQIGDTNLDGNINVNDVTALQRHLADLTTLTDSELAAADANGDGVVDINDATHLQKYLAEFNVALGKQS